MEESSPLMMCAYHWFLGLNCVELRAVVLIQIVRLGKATLRNSQRLCKWCCLTKMCFLIHAFFFHLYIHSRLEIKRLAFGGIQWRRVMKLHSRRGIYLIWHADWHPHIPCGGKFTMTAMVHITTLGPSLRAPLNVWRLIFVFFPYAELELIASSELIDRRMHDELCLV